MVTHDERMLAYCDRVYHMEDGKLILNNVINYEIEVMTLDTNNSFAW